MASWILPFESELNELLPADLPNRELVVQKGAAHLALIVEANRHFNLTRIVSPREAAAKHVLDSVLPWRLFSDAGHVLDAGTGAGFPGIPLALVLPGVRFTLAESIQKKARFVESAVAALDVSNVTVTPQRAEDVTKGVDIITARAVAPIPRALGLFAPALKRGVKLLLYKGPDAAREIEESAAEARKLRVEMKVIFTCELPEGMGTRTVVQIGI
ncbi:MAG TPA: 16S rRNA (guanine(527)-N(7))-methyltransferase RsmG [Bryobacteraceae bacterium]|jgi:16S rRNA (guanine527-N7)-methyltransferase|nr:16S rRNA (guanine(527)-N(7))-methyltransferase RsmG [Bryobacteraceae bacterium]